MNRPFQKILTILSAVFIGLGLFAAILGYGVYNVLRDGPLQADMVVMIEKGKGVSAIADTLEQQGVISSSLIFKIAARFDPDAAYLKAGEYAFPPHISMADVFEMLREGKVVDRKFTAREGLTSYQIVKLLEGVAELEGDIIDIPAEGSLLPETYHFTRGDQRQRKLDEMQAAMTKTLEELWATRVDGLPFTNPMEALTLASIVEKETGVASERRTVAGVFINRLKKGIPLQTDPTVIYALTKGKVEDDGQGPLGRRLLSKDLLIDDPYNTYKNAGLPPGPIANPGRESIAAVLNPETHDYLYFVADGTGGHVFAKTLNEHNANVAKWRKIRQSQ